MPTAWTLNKAERINQDRMVKKVLTCAVQMLGSMPDDAPFITQLDHVEEELKRRLDHKNFLRCHACDGVGERYHTKSHETVDCEDCDATGYMPYTNALRLQRQHKSKRPPRAN